MPKKSKEGEEAKEARRSYQEILSEEVAEGLSQIKRPWISLFIAGLSAGLDIGFGVLLMGVASTLFSSIFHPSTLKTMMSALYPIGFVLVIFGRSELFTEHNHSCRISELEPLFLLL